MGDDYDKQIEEINDIQPLIDLEQKILSDKAIDSDRRKTLNDLLQKRRAEIAKPEPQENTSEPSETSESIPVPEESKAPSDEEESKSKEESEEKAKIDFIRHISSKAGEAESVDDLVAIANLVNECQYDDALKEDLVIIIDKRCQEMFGESALKPQEEKKPKYDPSQQVWICTTCGDVCKSAAPITPCSNCGNINEDDFRVKEVWDDKHGVLESKRPADFYINELEILRKKREQAEEKKAKEEGAKEVGDELHEGDEEENKKTVLTEKTPEDTDNGVVTHDDPNHEETPTESN